MVNDWYTRLINLWYYVAMPNPGGRPPKIANEERAISILDEYLSYCEENKLIPYQSELASDWMDISEDTLQRYEDKWPTFAERIKKLESKQKTHLLRGEGAMSIFQLKANHGMMETEKRVLAGDRNEPIRVEVVDFE